MSTFFAMAAAYAFHIAENQPFLDGNKRAALDAVLVFLHLNGFRVEDPPDGLYDAMIAVAESGGSTRRGSQGSSGRGRSRSRSFCPFSAQLLSHPVSREAMTREAQSLRRDHNFAPDSAIRDVAIALRVVADVEALERVIATLPPAAADFWRVSPAPVVGGGPPPTTR